MHWNHSLSPLFNLVWTLLPFIMDNPLGVQKQETLILLHSDRVIPTPAVSAGIVYNILIYLQLTNILGFSASLYSGYRGAISHWSSLCCPSGPAYIVGFSSLVVVTVGPALADCIFLSVTTALLLIILESAHESDYARVSNLATAASHADLLTFILQNKSGWKHADRSRPRRGTVHSR